MRRMSCRMCSLSLCARRCRFAIAITCAPGCFASPSTSAAILQGRRGSDVSRAWKSPNSLDIVIPADEVDAATDDPLRDLYVINALAVQKIASTRIKIAATDAQGNNSSHTYEIQPVENVAERYRELLEQKESDEEQQLGRRSLPCAKLHSATRRSRRFHACVDSSRA